MGYALFFSGLSYILLVFSLVVAVISLLLSLIFKYLKKDGWKHLVYAFLISFCTPVFWLLWLDYT